MSVSTLQRRRSKTPRAGTRHGGYFEPGVGRKQERAAVYQAGAGKLLFVPLRSMWGVRNAATALSERGEEPSIANIARELGADIHATEAKIGHWRKLFGDFPWFNDWLFGLPAPPDVYVVTLDEIDRCLAAWDFHAHLAAAGARPLTYYRWIEKKVIPDLEWLKYFCGDRKPEGAFLIDEDFRNLRKQKTRAAILAAAGVGKTTRARWKKNEKIRAALKAARRVARKSGNRGQLPNVCPEWNQLRPRTQEKIWKYAKAATLRECCDRAGFHKGGGSDPRAAVKIYQTRKTEAERKKVWPDVEAYLKGADRSSEGKSFRAGLVARNLFVLPPKLQLFQEAAAAVRKEQRLGGLKIPGIDNWFLDTVAPWSNNGRRLPFPGIENVNAPRPAGPTWCEARRRELEAKSPAAEGALKAILVDGPVDAAEVKRRAAEAGVSTRQLRYAKKALGIRSKKIGWNGPVFWCLPGQEPQQGKTQNNGHAAAETDQSQSSNGHDDKDSVQAENQTQGKHAADLGLTDIQAELLDGLYKERAFNCDNRSRLSDIADARGLNDGTLRKAVARLKKLRLVESKEGREGGCWLTPSGKNFVEEARL